MIASRNWGVVAIVLFCGALAVLAFWPGPYTMGTAAIGGLLVAGSVFAARRCDWHSEEYSRLHGYPSPDVENGSGD